MNLLRVKVNKKDTRKAARKVIQSALALELSKLKEDKVLYLPKETYFMNGVGLSNPEVKENLNKIDLAVKDLLKQGNIKL